MSPIRLFHCRNNHHFKVRTVIFFLFILVWQVSAQPLANGHDKFLGNIIASYIPGNWNMYWNQVTPENASKWGSAEPSQDAYSWGGVDLAYNFALSRGIPFKFHTLIWGQQYPSWIMTLDSAQQAAEVEEWIHDVGTRYQQMSFIDVVNEPLPNHAPAPYRNALGGNGATGYDWVIKAFQWAREYCSPNVKLILNEYNILNDNGNTTELLKIVNLLKDRGLIDAIGIQAHNFEVRNVSTSTMIYNLDRLNATGLPVYISEFDINESDDNLQLQEYQRVFPVLWEHPAVKGITLWGYIQGEIWQVNGYLVRSNGTERPAMVWLRSYLLQSGTFRSYQSGNWNDTDSWERYADSVWVHPAPGVPHSNDGTVTILGGDTITVTALDSIDQLTINSTGRLVINNGVILAVKNGFGTDLTVDGTVMNYGTVSLADSATVRFRSGSQYLHAQDGGTVPTAIWSSGSICQVDSVRGTMPSNMNQDFYNLFWNCPQQTGILDLDWNGNTIGGNITVQSTGTGRVQMCAPAADETAEVTINGNVVQSGGELTTTGTDKGGTGITINHSGHITISGGNFSISRGSQGGTGTTVWNLLAGNFSMSNARSDNLTTTEGGAKFVFAKQGTQTLALGSGNIINSLPVEVSSGTTLSLGSSVLNGSGNFSLNGGATLECAHPNGLDGAIVTNGTKTFSKAAGYTFNGSAAQVTGSQLPDTVLNLILNNSAGVTLSNSIVVTGKLELKNGMLSLNENVLAYGTEGTLKYSGSTAQTTSDTEFPVVGGPKNLTVANPGNVILHASRTVGGNLDLSAKLRIGVNTFTTSSITNATSYRYVVTNEGGILRLSSVGATQQLFPVGVSTNYAPVWITNTGTVDTIGVGMVDDENPAAEGGRVKVRWDISESTAGDGNYTLQFGWMPGLEDAALKADRINNAKIFEMTDTTEAGSGMYTTQFSSQPYYVARGGITTLGPFAVGRFGYVDEMASPVSEVPLEFSLKQNYPNPFNPATTIRYTLGKSGKVKLIIYSVLGTQVRTLVDDFEQGGEHAVVWDARDNQQRAVASGIYFYRLVTAEQSMQKKMLLVR
jgi:endo-1,4-beta-xylanase